MFWVGFLLILIKSSSNWKIIIHSNTNKTFLNSLNWFSNLFVDNFPFKGVLLETTCHNNNYARENNFLCHRNAQKIHGGHSDPRPRHDGPGMRQGRRGGIGIILWRRGAGEQTKDWREGWVSVKQHRSVEGQGPGAFSKNVRHRLRRSQRQREPERENVRGSGNRDEC